MRVETFTGGGERATRATDVAATITWPDGRVRTVMAEIDIETPINYRGELGPTSWRIEWVDAADAADFETDLASPWSPNHMGVIVEVASELGAGRATIVEWSLDGRWSAIGHGWLRRGAA